VLCGEEMRGCAFHIHDVRVHPDSAHRRGDQIIPMVRNAVYGASLMARPRLLEPVYLVEIQCPSDAVGSIYRVLNRRRGQVVEETPRHPGTFFTIKAYLPVAESHGFTTELRASTSGQAFPQCSFDHWSPVPGNPLDAGDECSRLVRRIRTRRGLKADVPLVSVFYDRL
jgi:elongation factor 2